MLLNGEYFPLLVKTDTGQQQQQQTNGTNLAAGKNNFFLKL